MKLLVDLGNSRIKWAQSALGTWYADASLLQGKPITALLDTVWANMTVPEKVVVSSVASAEKLRSLERWVTENWARHAHVVKPGKELLGVKNHYRDPSSLGTDRWVGLVAARQLTSGPVCVVDCGTAVTMDALSQEGDFLGGVIFPGLRVLRESLVSATDGIRETAGSDADCFGRSTADSVAAGSVFGLAGAIERVLHEYRNHLGAGMQVLMSGADAPAVLPKLGFAVKEVHDLVLKGLAFIADEIA